MIAQFNSRILIDVVNSITNGKVFISAPRKSGKTSAIYKFYKTHINWDVAVIVPSEAIKYRYKQSDIHRVYLPENLPDHKCGVVLVDDANFIKADILDKVLAMSDHVVILSAPLHGSDFNKMIKDPDNYGMQFIGRDNPYLRAEMNEDRYREEVLGMIL